MSTHRGSDQAPRANASQVGSEAIAHSVANQPENSERTKAAASTVGTRVTPPIPSADVVRGLVIQGGGAQSPAGDHHIYLTLSIKALTPGGADYARELAGSPFWKQLGVAIHSGRVEITPELIGRREQQLAHAIGNVLQILKPAHEDYLDRGDDPAALWAIEQVGADVEAAYRKLEELRDVLTQLAGVVAIAPPFDGNGIKAMRAALHKLQLVDDATEGAEP